MKIKDFYNKNYEKGSLTYETKLEPILSIFFERKIKKLLDIGCGDGEFSKIAKEKLSLKEVFGIDISQKAVLEAKKKTVNAICLNVDEEKLPFKNSSFDGIYCGELIEHIINTDNLLAEIYRVLEPGGVFILTTPNLASWYNRFLLFFGFQPFFTDFSLSHSVGHLFKIDPTGHLMVGTLRAVREILEITNFKIIKEIGIKMSTKVGWGKKYSLLTKIANILFSSPKLSSGFIIICTK